MTTYEDKNSTFFDLLLNFCDQLQILTADYVHDISVFHC